MFGIRIYLWVVGNPRIFDGFCCFDVCLTSLMNLVDVYLVLVVID